MTEQDDFKDIVDLLNDLGFIRSKNRGTFEAVLSVIGTLVKTQIDLMKAKP